MLARSTAWRHGVGRNSANATSISSDVAVAHHQVGRLDVAVGETGVPQDADDVKSLVDQPVVDVGVAELDGVVEELGDEHVLAFGCQLDEAVRLGTGHAGIAEHAQRVVLLLHEATDGVERLLVLQPAVQQLATELVPAVRPQVGARVQLAEQVPRRRPLHA